METEQNDMTGKKFFTTGWVGFATYVGGPLAGGWLMAKNFKNFGESELARKSMWCGVAGTALLIVLVFVIPEALMEKVPNSVIPLIYTAIVAGLMMHHQDAKIKAALELGAKKGSGWKAFGIGLLSLLLLLVVFIGLTFLLMGMGILDPLVNESVI